MGIHCVGDVSQTYRDWRNVALTGSTEYPEDKELEDNFQEEDGTDARLVNDLDPRVGSLTRKLLEPMLAQAPSYEELAKAVDLDAPEEPTPFATTFTPEDGNSLDVEGAKRLLRRTLRGMRSPAEVEKAAQEGSEQEEAEEAGEEAAGRGAKEEFDVDGFRQLVQGYRAREAWRGAMTVGAMRVCEG